MSRVTHHAKTACFLDKLVKPDEELSTDDEIRWKIEEVNCVWTSTPNTDSDSWEFIVFGKRFEKMLSNRSSIWFQELIPIFDSKKCVVSDFIFWFYSISFVLLHIWFQYLITAFDCKNWFQYFYSIVGLPICILLAESIGILFIILRHDK